MQLRLQMRLRELRHAQQELTHTVMVCRHSTWFLLLQATGVLLLAALLAHGAHEAQESGSHLARQKGLVRTLGLTEGAVKTRLHRARIFLREALAPYFEGGRGTDDATRTPP